MAGALITYELTGNGILAALIGTLADNITYYSYLTLRESNLDKKKQKKNNQKYGFLSFKKTIRNLIIEFGPAEMLDFFLVRPLALILFPILLDDFLLGLLIGVIVADIIFYIPTITSYELKKKHLS